MNSNRLQLIVIWLAVFLIPWQTRYFVYYDLINGQRFDTGQFGIYATSLIILLVFVLRFKKIFWPRNFFWYTAIILFWLTMSASWSASPAAMIYYASLLIVAACLWLLVRGAPVKLTLSALVVSGILQAIIAIGQYVHQYIEPNKWLGLAEHNPEILGQSVIVFYNLRYLRAYGALPHPNILAGFLVVAIISLWWLMTSEAMRRNRARLLLCFLALAVMYLGLMVTFSRAGWIALLAIWLGLIIWLYLFERPKWRLVLMAGLLFIFLFGLINFFSNGLLTTRLDLGQRLEQISLTDRGSGYQQWWQLMTGQPLRWLSGIGAHNYWQALARQWPKHPDYYYQPVHNIFLLLIAEWGLIAWLTLLSLIVFFWQQVKKIRSPDLIWQVSPLVVLLIMGLFDHWIISSFCGLLLVAISFGLIRGES